MSLPLPRRIAQAALLLGAAAAPLLGAGAAHAAALPAQGLGGLTAPDPSGLGPTVENTSHYTTVLAADAGTEAMKATLPPADHFVGTLATTGVPAAQQAAGHGVAAARHVVGGAAESASGTVPGAAETLPATAPRNIGALPLADALPSSGPLTDQLPLKAVPLI